jgi:hypothetical protein
MSGWVQAQPIPVPRTKPKASEILARVDAKFAFKTRTSEGTFTVHSGTESPDAKSVSMQWRGTGEAYFEVTAPEGDAGFRLLKAEGELFMYRPKERQTLKVAGHMMTLAVLDSDFSFEDLLDATPLAARYTGQVIAEDHIAGKSCWVLALAAIADNDSIPRRRVWVDKTLGVPLQAELQTRTEVTLKTVNYADHEEVGERAFPTRITVRDHSRSGAKTELHWTQTALDGPVRGDKFDRTFILRPE